MSDDSHIDEEIAVDEETGQSKYASALDELEEILDEIEGSAVDVDTLAERVRRASELVALCRGRLDVVRGDVAAVVDDLTRQTGSTQTTPSNDAGSA